MPPSTGVNTCSCRTTPAAPAYSARTVDPVAVAAHATSLAHEGVEAPGPPARRHAAQLVVVGGRPPQAEQRGRGGQQRVDEQPVGVDLDRAGPQPGVGVDRAPAARSRTCGRHTSVPRGAQGSSPAVVTRSVSHASPPSSGSVEAAAARRPSRPGGRSGSSAGAVQRARRRRADSCHSPASQARSRKCWWLRDDDAPRAGRTPAVPARRVSRCSYIAGLGVRSGKTSPSARTRRRWACRRSRRRTPSGSPGAATPLS